MTYEFEAALDALEHDHLVHRPTDYQHRRQALKDWSIPPEDWQAQIIPPGISRNCRMQLGDRKRLAVSAYIWARATCGEHIFAPTPPEIRDDAARQEIWRRDLTTVCSLLKRPQRFPRYLMLKERLDAYADQLASSIDGET